MKRRYLIDDVCLWCARAFAAFSLIFFLSVAVFFVKGSELSFIRAQQVEMSALYILLSMLWLVCLSRPWQSGARLFLALSGCLYFTLAYWQVNQSGIGPGGIASVYECASLLGTICMIEVAVRPVFGHKSGRA